MTYLEIIEALRRAKQDSLVRFLDSCVEVEAKALLTTQDIRHKSPSRCRAAETLAQETYAHWISWYLEPENLPSVLAPEDVITYRCKAGAWAVAVLMRKAGLA